MPYTAYLTTGKEVIELSQIISISEQGKQTLPDPFPLPHYSIEQQFLGNHLLG
jgi:hypothetical protein